MLFQSLSFLIFFPIVCLVYFLLPKVGLRNFFLLGASYYFYMNWEPIYALLILSSTIITYFSAWGISLSLKKKNKKCWLWVSIILNLSILFLFKYYGFAAENLTTLLKQVGLRIDLPDFQFLLPVGISFYIFQALGYAIDVYRGKTEIERNFVTYALFVSFFPQLVAGPIERSNNLLPQFKQKHKFSYESFMSGIYLMLWGYFLKLVLADRCGLYVDPIFNNVLYHNGGSFLLASFFFTFQIYGDFAGYSLIAIGVAKIMGFKLMENFRRPYFSITITDFWHRWHISLSTWFKDYLYIPLGGNRCGRVRVYFNLMLTFIISGVWHGANWTFVIWGFIHGILLCIEKILGWNKKNFKSGQKFLHWVLTFTLVCFAWVFFRANTISDALLILKGIFFNISYPFLSLSNFFIIGLVLFIVGVKEVKDEFNLKFSCSHSSYWIVRHSYIVMMIAFILLFGVLNSDQFIYFQF